jgi:hypothetical protein
LLDDRDCWTRDMARPGGWLDQRHG